MRNDTLDSSKNQQAIKTFQKIKFVSSWLLYPPGLLYKNGLMSRQLTRNADLRDHDPHDADHDPHDAYLNPHSFVMLRLEVS